MLCQRKRFYVVLLVVNCKLTVLKRSIAPCFAADIMSLLLVFPVHICFIRVCLSVLSFSYLPHHVCICRIFSSFKLAAALYPYAGSLSFVKLQLIIVQNILQTSCSLSSFLVMPQIPRTYSSIGIMSNVPWTYLRSSCHVLASNRRVIFSDVTRDVSRVESHDLKNL